MSSAAGRDDKDVRIGACLSSSSLVDRVIFVDSTDGFLFAVK